MSEHITLETMHDLLDGLRPPSEEMLLRGHLQACAACREEFESLEATVTALRGMPDGAVVPEALWAGIEARIATGSAAVPQDPKVVPLAAVRRGPRRFSVTVPQLAAAAVVVSLVSATLVWAVLREGSGQLPATATAGAPAPESPSRRVASLGETGYEEAVAQLQTIIDAGRDVLAPETLVTLETSLRTVDDAIAEVRGALEADPSSEFLARLLGKHQQSKLRLLRQAAVSVQPRI